MAEVEISRSRIRPSEGCRGGLRRRGCGGCGGGCGGGVARLQRSSRVQEFKVVGFRIWGSGIVVESRARTGGKTQLSREVEGRGV